MGRSTNFDDIANKLETREKKAEQERIAREKEDAEIAAIIRGATNQVLAAGALSSDGLASIRDSVGKYPLGPKGSDVGLMSGHSQPVDGKYESTATVTTRNMSTIAAVIEPRGVHSKRRHRGSSVSSRASISSQASTESQPIATQSTNVLSPVFIPVTSPVETRSRTASMIGDTHDPLRSAIENDGSQLLDSVTMTDSAVASTPVSPQGEVQAPAPKPKSRESMIEEDNDAQSSEFAYPQSDTPPTGGRSAASWLSPSVESQPVGEANLPQQDDKSSALTGLIKARAVMERTVTSPATTAAPRLLSQAAPVPKTPQQASPTPSFWGSIGKMVGGAILFVAGIVGVPFTMGCSLSLSAAGIGLFAWGVASIARSEPVNSPKASSQAAAARNESQSSISTNSPAGICVALNVEPSRSQAAATSSVSVASNGDFDAGVTTGCLSPRSQQSMPANDNALAAQASEQKYYSNRPC